MISSDELITKIKQYHSNFDEELVKEAYNFSSQAHSSQSRSSGDPYFSHPLQVAEIIADFKLDYISVITALLHDVVEDTEFTLKDIEDKFGQEVATLVDGVTKLSKIEGVPSTRRAADNFRKLVMAMSQDIRVLLVKLADRLHNMRTINFIQSEERRKRIAAESLAIYAPLAARIGMYKIRDELQELSFEQIHYEGQNYVLRKLEELKRSEQDIIEKIISDLEAKLANQNINCQIHGREKKPYSIWNKMKNKKVGFGHLGDIMGFRILVNDIADCYLVLGVINTNYRMIPGSFKDYISTPKENGYQSLHLSALGPQNKKIEIQVRTEKMHQIAEMGVAAHWSYKEKTKERIDAMQYGWIRELIHLFEKMDDALTVLKNHKIHMHKDEVFCFSPDGDIFNLPNGATVIDFAYAVHSKIGDYCVSAKVNAIVAPLKQKLENGDQVEIITDENSKPSPSWLQFINTPKAKIAIKHFIRNEKHNEYCLLGKAILQKFFAANNLELNDKLLEAALKHFNRKSIDDLYVFVAEGLISRDDVLKAIYPDHIIDKKEDQPDQKEQDNQSQNQWFKPSSDQFALPIEGLVKGMAINLANCCNPIAGDKIVGVINVGRGVIIHNQTCRNLGTFRADDDRIINVCWKEGEESFYHSHIMVAMHNSSGSLADVSSIIAKNNVNISNIQINSRSQEFFDVIIDINVKNVEHLKELMSALRISEKVIGVSRF